MRIWHPQLIPLLCRQHILACWREALGAYSIITENKKGYRNHPAVQEFINAPSILYYRLELIRAEMIKRGYNPKPLPKFHKHRSEWIKEWENIDTQIFKLREKDCSCRV